MVLADELGGLAQLRSSGGLSEEEFVRAKERVLNPGPACCGKSVAAGVNKFRRSRTDRWIGGICDGLAKVTGTESWVWRLGLAGLFLFGGAGLLLYILLWIFVPLE